MKFILGTTNFVSSSSSSFFTFFFYRSNNKRGSGFLMHNIYILDYTLLFLIK